MTRTVRLIAPAIVFVLLGTEANASLPHEAGAALRFDGGVTTNRVFKPVADAYVTSARPRRNYGGVSELRAGRSPAMRSYLAFDLRSVPSATRVLLRVYATRHARTGYRVRSARGPWREGGVTYANAPGTSRAARSSPRFRARRWSSVDVTPLVRTGAVTTLALTAPSTSRIVLASRESARSPELVVTAAAGAPTVSITSPVSGTTYTRPETVTVTAVASDDRRIRKVEFYDGATLARTDRSPPYTHAWSFTSADNGIHTWTAKAYDDTWTRAVSAPVEVAVVIPQDRTGDASAPTAPSGLAASSVTQTSVGLSWSASSDNVSVAGYRVYVDGTNVGTTTATSYGVSGLGCGTSHTFGVEAYDAAGNVSARTTITASTSACATSDPVVAGAGDIADSGPGDSQTADVLDRIAPDFVFTLGDNAYETGTLSEFQSYYEPTWGRHKAKTWPSPGNHEYHSGGGGYFDYFASRIGGKAYYAWNVGNWRFYSLNSEIAMGAGSAQEQWLRQDLAANGAGKCLAAYFHRPLKSAGTHGDHPSVRPLAQALYEAGADLLLAGHDHNYQRWHKMNPDGGVDTVGFREFVVGTGGRARYTTSNRPAGLVAYSDQTWGVLKLTLHASSYDFAFVPVQGGTFTDSGANVPCNGDRALAPLPPPPLAEPSVGGVAAPTPPGQNYAIPVGATVVSSVAQLESELLDSQAEDIKVLAGTYSRSGPIAPNAADRVYCATFDGCVYNFGWNWRYKAHAEMHGGVFRIPDVAHAAVDWDSSFAIGTWAGTKANACCFEFTDLSVDGSGVVGHGIRFAVAEGVVVQRVRVRNFRDTGVIVETNQPDTPTDVASTITDLDVANIFRTPRGAADGTLEYGVFVGHPVLNPVTRIKVRNTGWGGIWTGFRIKDQQTVVSHFDVDDVYGTVPWNGAPQGVGIYVEHKSGPTIFRNFWIGPGVRKYGAVCEWAQAAADQLPACDGTSFEDGRIEAQVGGICFDEGTRGSRAHRITFVGQSYAGIGDVRPGSPGNSYSENDYSGVDPGAAAVTTADCP